MLVTQRDLARAATRHTTTRLQTNLVGDADSGLGSLALDFGEGQLDAAMRQIGELLRIRTSLAKRVSALEGALLKAHRLTHYDELTGLPNRRLLLDRFIQAAALANRHRHQLALLFFDLNDFKGINDKLGHDAGDKLLQQVAKRLMSSIRTSDTACRYGGDEFVVLLTEIADREHAVKALQEVRADLAAPYTVGRFSIRITASIGLAIYPEDAQSFTDLLQKSDRLMFDDKPGSRGRTSDAHNSKIWLHDAEKLSCINQ